MRSDKQDKRRKFNTISFDLFQIFYKIIITQYINKIMSVRKILRTIVLLFFLSCNNEFLFCLNIFAHGKFDYVYQSKLNIISRIINLWFNITSCKNFSLFSLKHLIINSKWPNKRTSASSYLILKKIIHNIY